MPKLPDDIKKKIALDFHTHSCAAIETLTALKSESVTGCEDEEELYRVLRCLVVMSRGNIDNLVSAIEMAQQDYQDVIMNGEYETRLSESSDSVRVRDLSQPFRFDEG